MYLNIACAGISENTLKKFPIVVKNQNFTPIGSFNMTLFGTINTATMTYVYTAENTKFILKIYNHEI